VHRQAETSRLRHEAHVDRHAQPQTSGDDHEMLALTNPAGGALDMIDEHVVLRPASGVRHGSPHLLR
jgi:hypothetical protein